MSLLGGAAGTALRDAPTFPLHASFLALTALFLALALLPLLHQRLLRRLKAHAYLSAAGQDAPEIPLPTESALAPATCRKPVTPLTRREQTVLEALLTGKSYRQMALDLHVSENTLKTHIKSVYSKFCVHGRVELLTAPMPSGTDAPAPHKTTAPRAE